jgi:hypothetical protein
MNLFDQGEYSVEDVITFLELILVIITVIQVWG